MVVQIIEKIVICVSPGCCSRTENHFWGGSHPAHWVPPGFQRGRLESRLTIPGGLSRVPRGYALHPAGPSLGFSPP